MIYWVDSTQHFVTLSSTEREFVALAEVTREHVLFLRLVLDFIHPGFVTRRVTIFEDHGGVVKLVGNPIYIIRTKHVDFRCHHTRERIADDTIVHVES